MAMPKPVKRKVAAERKTESYRHPEADSPLRRDLAGTTSAPFEAGKHDRIAVKAIDDRGNELPMVKSLGKAE